ncbi:hypothetical protein ACG9XS_06250 [Acinetobacter gyllenbergii]|uniref:hypothetical protein n=1 Tax=Acinetobacter gyllenbergii TaxID=134534 RepID=UPI0003BE42FB|nr:hypothetical protein [Acinetobacter gyllenbergii]ESK55656.1 hypothetical protein F987_00531 [Acinetobacter gyllenbergii NIPH 230]
MRDIKNSKYLDLLKLRKKFLWILFLIPSVIILCSMIFGFDEKYIMFFLPLLLIPVAYFSIFYFLSKDICPWCGHSFFIGKNGFFSNGLDFVFRRKCASCGEPKEEDS